MVNKGVSSLGLLDEDDMLAGVFSMTDIKYIFHFRDFQCLKDPLSAFVSGIRQIAEVLKGKTHYPLFSVRPETTLDAVVHKLVTTHSHRVYVSEDMEPVGVVTMTDVIRSLPLFK
jgi:CBS-domain-containing membrane protein